MLFSQNRLRKKGDIKNVFKKGKIVAGDFIFLRFAKNNLNINRFAFVVSLKVSKKAILRNKIKRQLRELIKKITPEIKQGLDFIVIVKQEAISQKYETIKKEINEIFYSKLNKVISKKHF